MNDPRTCKHDNLRKTVRLIVSLPANSNKLDKKAIRSKDVQIDAALWDHIHNYIYCADCGMVIRPTNFIGRMADVTQSTNKIARIKAVREMTGYCGLKEAKYFVDVAFEDYGRGDPLPVLHDMTVEDVKRIVSNKNVEQYQSILLNWGK